MIKRTIREMNQIHSAYLLVTLSCPFPPHHPKWHETQVYRAKRGGYFMAGKGGWRSRWAQQTPKGAISGKGLEPITQAEARAYAIQYGMPPDRFPRMGFERPENP